MAIDQNEKMALNKETNHAENGIGKGEGNYEPTKINRRKKKVDKGTKFLLQECEACGKSFVNGRSFQEHMNKHLGVRDYKCNKCPKEFFYFSSFQSHILTHLKVKQNECTICGFRCREKGNLKKHVRIHFRKKIFPCPCCQQKFSYRPDLKRHFSLDHKNEITLNIAEYIKTRFPQGRRGKVGANDKPKLRTGVNNKPKLTKLKTGANNKPKLTTGTGTHIKPKLAIGVNKKPKLKSGANSKPKLIVGVKEKPILTIDVKNKPKLKVLTSDGLIKNEKCNKLGQNTNLTVPPLTYRKAQNAQEKTTSHSGDLMEQFSAPIKKHAKVPCPEEMPRRLATPKTANIEHTLSHTAIKLDRKDASDLNTVRPSTCTAMKYECLLCGARFAMRSTLVTHKRIHKGEKTYKCGVCLKIFSFRSNLDAHQVTHRANTYGDARAAFNNFLTVSHIQKKSNHEHSGAVLQKVTSPACKEDSGKENIAHKRPANSHINTSSSKSSEVDALSKNRVQSEGSDINSCPAVASPKSDSNKVSSHKESPKFVSAAARSFFYKGIVNKTSLMHRRELDRTSHPVTSPQKENKSFKSAAARSFFYKGMLPRAVTKDSACKILTSNEKGHNRISACNTGQISPHTGSPGFKSAAARSFIYKGITTNSSSQKRQRRVPKRYITNTSLTSTLMNISAPQGERNSDAGMRAIPRTVGSTEARPAQITDTSLECNMAETAHMKSFAKSLTIERKFSCDRCPKTFKQSSHLHRHSLKHDGVTFECNICSRIFSQEANRDRHIGRVHTKNKSRKGTQDEDPANYQLSRKLTNRSMVCTRTIQHKYKIGFHRGQGNFVKQDSVAFHLRTSSSSGLDMQTGTRKYLTVELTKIARENELAIQTPTVTKHPETNIVEARKLSRISNSPYSTARKGATSIPLQDSPRASAIEKDASERFTSPERISTTTRSATRRANGPVQISSTTTTIADEGITARERISATGTINLPASRQRGKKLTKAGDKEDIFDRLTVERISTTTYLATHNEDKTNNSVQYFPKAGSTDVRKGRDIISQRSLSTPETISAASKRQSTRIKRSEPLKRSNPSEMITKSRPSEANSASSKRHLARSKKVKTGEMIQNSPAAGSTKKSKAREEIDMRETDAREKMDLVDKGNREEVHMFEGFAIEVPERVHLKSIETVQISPEALNRETAGNEESDTFEEFVQNRVMPRNLSPTMYSEICHKAEIKSASFAPETVHIIESSISEEEEESFENVTQQMKITSERISPATYSAISSIIEDTTNEIEHLGESSNRKGEEVFEGFTQKMQLTPVTYSAICRIIEDSSISMPHENKPMEESLTNKAEKVFEGFTERMQMTPNSYRHTAICNKGENVFSQFHSEAAHMGGASTSRTENLFEGFFESPLESLSATNSVILRRVKEECEEVIKEECKISFQEFSDFCDLEQPTDHEPEYLLSRPSLTHEGKIHNLEESGTQASNNIDPLSQPLSGESQTSLECDVCQRAFSTKFNLDRHKRLHKRNMRCPQISIRSQDTNQLARKRKRTLKYDLYQRQICSRVGKTTSNKSGNNLASSKNKSPVPCPICNRRFTTKSSFTKHRRTCKMDNTSCDLTKRKLTNSQVWKQIIYENTDNTDMSRPPTQERTFNCNVCQKQFAKKENLTEHELNHAVSIVAPKERLDPQKKTFKINNKDEKKAYDCSVCNKRFTKLGNLVRHRLTHPTVTALDAHKGVKTLKTHTYIRALNTQKRVKTSSKKKLTTAGNISMDRQTPIVEIYVASEPSDSRPTNEDSMTVYTKRNNEKDGTDSLSQNMQTGIELIDIKSEQNHSKLTEQYHFKPTGKDSTPINQDIKLQNNETPSDKKKSSKGRLYKKKPVFEELYVNSDSDGSNLTNKGAPKTLKIPKEKKKSTGKKKNPNPSMLTKEDIPTTSHRKLRNIGRMTTPSRKQDKWMNIRSMTIPSRKRNSVRNYYKLAIHDSPTTPSRKQNNIPVHNYRLPKKGYPTSPNDGIERNFKCDLCEKCYVQKSTLSRHYKVHTGEKKYQCDMCNKRFSQKSILVRHMFIHTGEKNHQCHICLKLFSLKGGLQYHLLSHKKEKPLECSFCSKRFKRKGELGRHIIYKHGDGGDSKKDNNKSSDIEGDLAFKLSDCEGGL